MIHRGDLQATLLKAADAEPNISLKLGMRIEDYAAHAKGVSVHWRRRHETGEDAAASRWSAPTGCGRACACGSAVPRRAFAAAPPGARLAPAEAVTGAFQEPDIHLWLGQDAHLVHYPVMGSALINIVAIVRDDWQEPGWTASGSRDEIRARFAPSQWAEPARTLLDVPTHWLKWALYDGRPLRRWGHGPVTLIGDAGHPMLPFLAQGAAMAIEDAFVLSECLGNTPDDPVDAMRRYERHRKTRTARVQRAARRNGRVYHLAGLPGWTRNRVMRALGGDTAARALRLALWLARPVKSLRADYLKPRRQEQPHVPDHHRRQPAEAVLARRAEQAVGAVATCRHRTRNRQARCDADRHQAAGGCRHRHRLRRRAGAPALRARLPRSGRGHRLLAARRDGHPQQSLQGDGADRERSIAAARPRARERGTPRPRPHRAQAQVHAARAR